MSPLEQFDYKQKWYPGYQVAIHTDMRHIATTWVKKICRNWQWMCVQYTDVYEDTYCFEHKRVANAFYHKHQNYARKLYNEQNRQEVRVDL